MKRYLIVLLAFLPLFSYSQVTGKLYDDMCDPLQAVFCDYVKNEASVNSIMNDAGQYIGTVIDDNLYGWGVFFSNLGITSYGQYRNGRFMFGMIITETIAKVGSENNYVMYDLATGGIISLHTTEGDIDLEYPYIPSVEEPVSPYSFRKETYSNGDVFIGEFFEGRRHGYGVYSWSNGDFWYGQYKDGYRNGYGMLIKTNNHVYYGKWVGDRKVE